MLSIQRIARFVVFACALPALAAGPIAGTVTNRTTGKPAAGDDVVLIRLQQGMQESTRTKTDARGRFTLDVPDDGIHLVRVTHDKANYFKPVQPGTQSIEMDVFSAAPKVKGVTEEADVLRIQTEPGGKQLKVIENFFIKNDSKPQMTQFSEVPFELTLPDGAIVDGSAALAPGGMPVQAAPVPLPQKGHYTFLFPIRPGETRFQVTYHIPYSGSFTFRPNPSLPTDTIAIMMPKSMGFKADDQAPYSAVTDEVDAQTYVARNVNPGQPLSFTLTGTGALPRDTQNPAAGQSAAEANANAQPDANGNPDQSKFGGGMAKPLDPDAEHDPWAKYKWWILSGLALLLAVAAGVLLRKPAAAPVVSEAAPVAPVPSASLQQVLKEEMFQLETDRLQNRISEQGYAEHKRALDLILRRALNRGTGA